MATTPSQDTASAALKPAEQAQRQFSNGTRVPHGGFGKTLGIFWKMLFHKPRNTRPVGEVPVQSLTREQLLAAPDHSVFRLGHSTVLLKMRGKFWLTDPVFAERASPFSWAGPKRFHQPPISLAALPPLEAVVLSHNHYDHLDRKAVIQLAGKTRFFLAPLGVGDTLIKWGVEASKVRQLDWWEDTEVEGIRFVATPAQHFSGRGLFDGNQTLWCSWVMIDAARRIFFSGDTGYFDSFKRIGEQYGPFDLTLMETGAYNVDWPHVHMQPEQTLQAHIDLKGRWLLPIHNGTFDLAFHAWHEPFDRIMALAWERNVLITTPAMGQAFNLNQPERGHAWWLEVEAQGAQARASS
ncbi:MBL fold metallo-hydrolase [Pseudomonas poae]|uniref:L-ascorbate metabolism protein UlaG, beta-lactamase superfamily n=1 Tax=Pseudomonas poae TaxID=200451 RepID=A0ABY0S0M6_9PSED|nr:MBL fold metallo-hydrolase [Pseudomonas poae]KRP47775.1 hydrolase [Pseudomonas poae]SDO68703.1 L-ascorbate metabolism protein UlaG, beta-lactamase superfamily [Pseudomonas poae]